VCLNGDIRLIDKIFCVRQWRLSPDREVHLCSFVCYVISSSNLVVYFALLSSLRIGLKVFMAAFLSTVVGPYHLTSPSSLYCWVKNLKLTISVDILTGEFVAGYKAAGGRESGWTGSWGTVDLGHPWGLQVIALFNHDGAFVTIQVPFERFRCCTTTISQRQIWAWPCWGYGAANVRQKFSIIPEPMCTCTGIDEEFSFLGHGQNLEESNEEFLRRTWNELVLQLGNEERVYVSV
jgi:hypothetical protein